jgi:hypothetical protein
MWRLLYASLVLAAFPIFGGCGPNLSSKDFGTVVEGIPKVEGADKPFEMPELGPPLPEDYRPKKGH